MRTNKKHIAISLGVSALLITLLLFYVEFRDQEPALQLDEETGEPLDMEGPLTPEEQSVSNAEVTNTMNPTAIITTNRGVIELELFRDQMPVTVGNFVALAESGFYDNTKFHRVIDNFMIQGGDPLTKEDDESAYGTGGSDPIQDEFVEGELLTNTRGTIAMANTGQPNSGSSQFFINLADNTGLDFDKQPLSSKHPVFGRVVEGMDVVDAISDVETNARDLPVEAVAIESVEIVER